MGQKVSHTGNSLLKYHEYVKAIQGILEVICITKSQKYSSQNQKLPSAIKEIQNQDLVLTIVDQLFWESLLLQIRGKTITYSSYKKKQENNREAELLKEIENLEKQENSDFEACDKKKEV